MLAETVETSGDKLLDKAMEIITQLQALAPEIADATLRAVWWQGMLRLVFAAVLGAICVVVLCLTWRKFWRCIELSRGCNSYREADKYVSTAIGVVGVWLVAAGTSVIYVLPQLLSYTNWIAMFDPAAALALRVLEWMDQGGG